MSSVTQTSDTKYLLDFTFFSSKPVEQRLNKARGSQTLSCPKENMEQRNIRQMMCEGINWSKPNARCQLGYLVLRMTYRPNLSARMSVSVGHTFKTLKINQ